MAPALAPELVREIARLRADGHTRAATAALLHIGQGTVDRYWNARHAPAPHPPRPPAPTRRWNFAWHEDAACRDAGGASFLGAGAEVRTLHDGYCSRCPVMRQCYRWAEQDKDFEGVAGGVLWTGHIRGARKKGAA